MQHQMSGFPTTTFGNDVDVSFFVLLYFISQQNFTVILLQLGGVYNYHASADKFWRGGFKALVQ
jgi:hypothetical protein